MSFIVSWPVNGQGFRFRNSFLVLLLLLVYSLLGSSGSSDPVEASSGLLLSNESSGVPNDWDTVACSQFKKLPLPDNNTTSETDFRCMLVQNLTSCTDSGAFIPYLSLIYCSLPGVKPVAYIILFLWLIFLFISLGITAEDFFCPALTTISQTLGLSQNIAGVTFLAIGNGAPDIFSAFAAIQQSKNGDAGLAIGALFGAGVFVTTTVVGAICITRSFALTKRPFLRDVIFYLAAVFWTFFVLWNHIMTTWQAAGFIGLYIFYVLVVIIGRYIYVRNKRRPGGDIPSPAPRSNGKELSNAPAHAPQVRRALDLDDDDDHDEEGDESSPLLPSPRGPTNYGGADVAASINADSSEAVRPLSSSSVLPNGSAVPATARSPSLERSGGFVVARRSLSRQSSRNRSGSFHGVTDHLRQVAEGQDTAVSSQQGTGIDVDAPDGACEENPDAAMRIHQDFVHSHAHPRMRKSTVLFAGALAGLASTSSAATAPIVHQMPARMRRSNSMGHMDIESLATSPADRPEHSHSSALPLPTPRRAESAQQASVTALPLKTFLLAVLPFDMDTFRTESFLWKAYDLFKLPIQFMLLITTPVVALDQEDQNWNRHLNSVQCFTGPVVITLLISGVSSYVAAVVPSVALVAAGGLILALVVFFTSRNDDPPRYHRVFAFVGFCVSVVWIYAIANEIVSLLTTFGMVFGISDAILGLTLLAWGNSIGDFVSNVTMAKQGFPRMAIAACFGGPLLNVLLGIGVACLVKGIKHGGSFCLHFKPLQILCAGFLMASLSISLISMSLLGFNTSKKFGIALICFYVVFLSVAIMEEVHLIPWETHYPCPRD